MLSVRKNQARIRLCDVSQVRHLVIYLIRVYIIFESSYTPASAMSDDTSLRTITGNDDGRRLECLRRKYIN